jgi:hypothetical protein
MTTEGLSSDRQKPSHDESQTQLPTSASSPIIHGEHQASTTLIPAPTLVIGRQVFMDESNTHSKRILEFSEPSYSKQAGTHTQLTPGSFSWRHPGYLDLASKTTRAQEVEHSHDSANFDNAIDADMLSPCIEQLGIELFQFLSCRKERSIRRRSQKTHSGSRHSSSLEERSLSLGIRTSSKRAKLYQYVRRRGVEFLTEQLQVLRSCLIAEADPSGAISETSLARRIAERHPKYPHLSQVVALVRQCMSGDFQQIIAAKGNREVMRVILMLVQQWASTNKT